MYNVYCIQWNLSTADTIGADSSVLNREVSLIQRLLSGIGTAENVLFIEVSSFQGSSLERFHCMPIYMCIYMHQYTMYMYMCVCS